MHPLQPSESRLLAAVAGVLLIAAFGPPVAQPADYHAFADAHTRWGVPHAFDVLSNLPFALVAIVGAWRLWRLGDALDPVQRALAWLACAGLALTTVGSSWYHLHPDDAGLVVDRGAIAIVFAGIAGLAACRISVRTGASLGLALLAAGPVSVAVWFLTGNLLPWAALQGGGMVLLVVLCFSKAAPGALPVRWGLVIAAYAVAKLLEAADHGVWQLTGELVSGHTLKHLVAAAAAWPLVDALGRLQARGQNAPAMPRQAA